MPRPYALEVTSRPTKVSEDVWTQWYTTEHLRDIVYSGASRTGALYRATTPTVATNTSQDDASGRDDTKFLALYQTGHKSVFEAARSPERKCKVRIHSELFEPGHTCYDVGVFGPSDLQLVEVLGSYETREDVAPCVVRHVIWGEDIENKIQFDHVNALSQWQGYRRTLLYRPLAKRDGGGEPFVILIHEFDDEVEGEVPESVEPELERIEPTKGCAFQLRAYSLVDGEGFGGVCRTPARMEPKT